MIRFIKAIDLPGKTLQWFDMDNSVEAVEADEYADELSAAYGNDVMDETLNIKLTNAEINALIGVIE